MSIKDYEGNKITANQKAKELILESLENLDWSWCDESIGMEWQSDGMTDKEIKNVSLQLKKRINSICKLFGYCEIHTTK